MIVRLSPDAPPALDDVDRLDRLHAECPGPLASMATGPLCRADEDGEHVWLDIAAARAAGAAASADQGFGDRFDAMIEFATSKGWTDDAGTHVRAHIERTGGTT
jgi:hypothetical protein